MTAKTETLTKIEALAKFLNCKIDDLEEIDDQQYSSGNEEYLVLTDDEADEYASVEIHQSLWAFNAWFIADHTKNGHSDDLEKSIKKIQEQCEGANSAIEAMIEDMGDFVGSAIAADGRGHFLNHYDGNENELGEYFIYRTN